MCGLGAKNEEQESKTARKITQVKEGGRGFISRAVKTENPVPRFFFAPKLNGNACYAGYRGAYIWTGDLTEGFFALPDWGAYTWWGLFSEFY